VVSLYSHGALEQVSNDFCAGDFEPGNESDVQCRLYESFLRTKNRIKGLTRAHRILSEFPDRGSGQKVDLTIAKWNEPRLLLEIKETRNDHLPPEEIEKRIAGDVEKLRRYKKKFLQDKTGKPHCDLVIYFFFRDATKNGIGIHTKHGIGIRTHRSLERLKSNYRSKGIILEWGPV
jgi:hypothetical protein